MRKDTMSKLSLIITPKAKVYELDFLTVVQGDVNPFFADEAKKKTLENEEIMFTWYDDAPVSVGVALTAMFKTLDGFDILAELQIYLRKKYNVSVNLGY